MAKANAGGASQGLDLSDGPTSFTPESSTFGFECGDSTSGDSDGANALSNEHTLPTTMEAQLIF